MATLPYTFRTLSGDSGITVWSFEDRSSVPGPERWGLCNVKFHQNGDTVPLSLVWPCDDRKLHPNGFMYSTFQLFNNAIPKYSAGSIRFFSIFSLSLSACVIAPTLHVHCSLCAITLDLYLLCPIHFCHVRFISDRADSFLPRAIHLRYVGFSWFCRLIAAAQGVVHFPAVALAAVARRPDGSAPEIKCTPESGYRDQMGLGCRQTLEALCLVGVALS